MKKTNKKLTVMMGVTTGMALITLVTFCIMLFVIAQNKKALDNLTFSRYESPYEEFDFLSNYDFLYCYGDVSQDDIDSTLSDFAAWFPNTFTQFLDEDGVIFLTNDFLSMTDECLNLDYDDKKDQIRGLFSSNYNRPVICINLSKPTNYDSEDFMQTFVLLMESSNTPIHEMAHYIGHKKGFSSTDEFKEYFTKYAADYEPRNAVIEGYQATDEKEFFAVLFTDFLRNAYNENFEVPSDLKEFMLNAIGEEL